MALEYTDDYLSDAISLFRYYKKLAEAAMEQVDDAGFFQTSGEDANSIALIVKHVAGNLRSRWTDFLTSDGEKSWRNRDGEFELAAETRAHLMHAWNEGWQVLLAALDMLSAEDLARKIVIRGEKHSVMQAVNRALAHAAYHSGQIVFAAKQLCHRPWKSLSIPKGQSAEFHRHVQSGEASQR